MVRESGLSMDSDPINNNGSSPKHSIIPFQLNHSSPTTSHETRKEMNFFKDKNNLDDNVASVPDNDHSLTPRLLEFKQNTGLNLLTAHTSSDQSLVDNGISPNSEDKRTKYELEILQAELERMKSENQRLRDMLDEATNNYNVLQMLLSNFMKEHKAKLESEEHKASDENGRAMVPTRQFMDLETNEPITSLDRLGSPANNIEVVSKDLVNAHKRSSPPRNVEQPEATMKKPRVAVRTISESPIINDGCHWRKYGQKMAKGNPNPRAYYKCTMATSCPVRKQVQRCAQDKAVLITTYENDHNHPLPPAAMAMAQSISSASKMLLSRQMSSSDGLINPNFLTRTLLPNTSCMLSTSVSAPFPTITLDLTNPQNQNQKQFQRPLQLPFSGVLAHNFANSTAASLMPQKGEIVGHTLCNHSQSSGLQMSQNAAADSSQLGNQAQQQVPTNLADTISAAIAADPNFIAALAAAITSNIGGSNRNANNTNNTTTNGNNSNDNITSGNNNSNGKQ